MGGEDTRKLSDEGMDGDLNRDYYVSDSDEDNSEDFDYVIQPVELAYGHFDRNRCLLYEDENKEKKEDRKCLHVSRCNKFQHSITLDFQVGLPIFELFKVTLRLQDNKDSSGGFSSSSSAPFYGAIVMQPEMRSRPVNPTPISYYWVSKNNANSITLYSDQNFNLPLSGPKPRPFIATLDWITLKFAFKFNNENVFKGGGIYKNSELYGDDDDGATERLLCLAVYNLSIYRQEKGGPRISRVMFGPRDCNRIIVSAYYSIYHGTWATVDIKFLNKGSASKFYGLIFARPCIFYSRIRLLSIKSTRLLELQESQPVVELTRSVVAVPFYSSLIIAVDLYDQDDEDLFCGKTFFPASTKGSHSKCIEDKNTGAMLQVTVKWSCEP